jgi:F-type H+-transporting ATPase subunit delta
MKKSAKQYAQVLFSAVSRHPGEAREIVRAFLKELHDRRSFNLISQIMQSVTDLQNEKEGVSEVFLYSAKPLHESVKQTMLKLIEKKQWVTNTVRFKDVIDPSLLGGMQIKIKDRLIDLSYKHALGQFEQQIAARD